MSDRNLTVNIALKSNSFQQNLKQVNSSIKSFKSEAELAVKSSDKFSNTQEQNAKTSQALSQALESAKKKVALYTSEIKNQEKVVNDCKSALERQKSAIAFLQNQLEQARKKFGDNSTEVKNLEGALNKAEKTLKTTDNAFVSATNRLDSLKNSSIKAEIEVADLENELDKIGDTADDTEGKFSKLGDGLKSFGSKIGSISLGLAKVGGALIATGTTLAGTLTKLSIDAYAEYEQLVGGVDTLFKDSSAKVQEYANNAYKSAGLSANDYMETVTSFSASLLQSLGGDTAKSAEIADQAIIDMSDNANKMGFNQFPLTSSFKID